jgi:hypothetical protein
MNTVDDADADDEVEIDAHVVTTKDGGKLSKDEDNLIIIRIRRRHVTPSQREFIWESSKKCCYICQKPLLKDDFQIEHVVAFSEDPFNNDTIGNMLPACANCNQKKGAKSLVDVINENSFTTNLMTSAAAIKHLCLAAKNVIEAALIIKHNRNLPNARFTPEIIADKILQLDALLDHNDVTPEEMRHFLMDVAPFQLDPNDITEGEILGRGGFGVVRAGILKIYNPSSAKLKCNHVAIKMMDYSVAAFRELSCLGRLQHKNIVKYFGYYLPPDQCLSIVIDLCNFSLDSLIKEINCRCAASIANPFKVIYDVCAALSYMHGSNCLHRDIKPANILLVGPVRDGHLHDCKTKICDFGTSKFNLEGVVPT